MRYGHTTALPAARRATILLLPALVTVAAFGQRADGAEDRRPIPIVVGRRASDLERLAGEQLADFLSRIYPKERFVRAAELPPRGRAIVLGAVANTPLVQDLLDGRELAGDGGFLVTTARQNGRQLGVIAGAGPRAALHGVYALLEELGCGFYLSYDTVPVRGRRFDFRGWDLADAPLVGERIVLNWHNFLSSCSTWDLPEWRQWIEQAAKMRFTGIMVHAYGNNPMVCYEHNGQTKPVGYLSTTLKGRDWGTQHVNDVRRLQGAAEVFEGPVFGSSAALVPDEQRVSAAKRLMQQAFACAQDRGLDVLLAVDVDTPSSNPANAIMTLPPTARFESAGHALANPDTPEGLAYYRAQVESLLTDYPQIDRLVIWFRRGGTPWRRLTAEDFPEAWQAEYRTAASRAPDAGADRDGPSMFALAKVVRAFRKALDGIGRADVTLGIGTWGFGHMTAADAFMPREVTFLCLDYSIRFDTPEVERQIRAVGPRRAVIPIVWAHHDDRTYVGRPYTPFPDFGTRLQECRSAGFGIIHWTTRPLDLYFKSLSQQVWGRTRDEPIEETCRQMAERSFGPGLREQLGHYLAEWIANAPQFGRETTDQFMDRPLDSPEETVASCRRRLALLDTVDQSSLDSAARRRLEYFKLLERFFVGFYRDQTSLQESVALLERGDLAGARAAMAKCQPESTIELYAEASCARGITRGEQGLIVSMNLRWLPYFEAQRQALGLAPVRVNFQPTQHDQLAQGAGRRTFYVDRQRRLWIGLGEKETGVPAYELPARAYDLPATVDGEICRTGLESEVAIRLHLRTMTGRALTPGTYRVHLLLLDPSSDAAGQRVFDLGLRGSQRSGALQDRVDVFERGAGRAKVVRLPYLVQVDQGSVEVRLTPVRGRVLLCGAILEAEALRGPPPVVREREASELPIASIAATGSVSGTYAPQKASDLDLRTRWAAEGAEHWIQCDLGRMRRISRVAIAWFRGDERRARFDILVSADGMDWRRAHTGQSSGATSPLEAVDLDGVEARYVRVLCRGNSDNLWNSITELAVYGE